MDYSTLPKVKAALGAAEATDDDMLGSMITAASRVIDRRATGVHHAASDDFFKLEDKTDEIVRAVVDRPGCVICWPHKAVVNSVSAFAYRANPQYAWITVDLASRVTIDGATLIAWVDAAILRGNKGLRAKVSYNGGYATSADGLPADLVELCTMLAVRFYREARASYSDVIGVSELGAIFFSKAFPQRFEKEIQALQRVAPW